MMKRTEKSKPNSRQKSTANSRQDKSIANDRQDKSRANGRQSKPKDCDRDKAKYGEKHTLEESSSQPGPKHPRTDAYVLEGQQKLKLGDVITTIPKIDFNEETVEYRNLSFTVQKDTEVIDGEVEGGTKINFYLKENQSEFSEKKRRLKELVKKHSERKSPRQLRSSDSESPEDRDDHTGQRS